MKVWALVNDRRWANAYRDLRDMGVITAQHGSIGPKDGETFVLLSLNPEFGPLELETDPDVLQAGDYHSGDEPVKLGLWPDSDPSWASQGADLARKIAKIPDDVSQGVREGVSAATSTALLMAGGIGFLWLAMRRR